MTERITISPVRRRRDTPPDTLVVHFTRTPSVPSGWWPEEEEGEVP